MCSAGSSAQASPGPSTPKGHLTKGCTVTVGDVKFVLPPNPHPENVNQEPLTFESIINEMGELLRLNRAIGSGEFPTAGFLSQHAIILNPRTRGTSDYIMGTASLMVEKVEVPITVRYNGGLPPRHFTASQRLPGYENCIIVLLYFPETHFAMLFQRQSAVAPVAQPNFPLFKLEFLVNAFCLFQYDSLETMFPQNYFSEHTSEIGIQEQLRLFEKTVGILRGIVQSAHLGDLDSIKIVSALSAQEYIIGNLTAQLLRHGSNDLFEDLLDQFEDGVRLLISYVDIKTLPTYANYRMRYELLIERLNNGIERLRLWNEEKCFSRGTSSKFDGITSFSDFYPKENDPEVCGVCQTTPLSPTSDFGILSDCSHIFCSKCLERWFKSRSTCPMCRAESYWMNESVFLELRSRKKQNACRASSSKPSLTSSKTSISTTSPCDTLASDATSTDTSVSAVTLQATY